jgi:CRP/FNR family transcriptional regulator
VPLEEALERAASARRLKARQPIFEREDAARAVYMVASGKVRIYIADPSGNERTLKIAGPGDLFGEAAVFQEGGYPASAATLTECEVLEFPKGALLSLVREHPELAFACIGVLAARLRELTRLIESSLKPVGPRLAAYLLSLPADGGKVTLPIRKAELARHLGTTPESLSRALRKLKKAELITDDKRTIYIADRAGLKDHALG